MPLKEERGPACAGDGEARGKAPVTDRSWMQIGVMKLKIDEKRGGARVMDRWKPCFIPLYTAPATYGWSGKKNLLDLKLYNTAK